MASLYDQQKEIEQLKAEYGKDCRVLEDVGDFTYLVDIKFSTCTLKFQLTCAYPSVTPEIIVKSNTLPETVREQLQNQLVEECKQHHEPFVLHYLVKIACDWLEKNQVTVDVSQSAEPVPATKVQGKKNKGKKSKSSQNKSDTSTGKKPPMKTADDVIKRILWDGSLPAECFIVGYIDRFKGIIEKAFSAFSWEDLASADYSVLAIPKHRIQYFKYKTLKVWDKNDRLDLMFGSTSSGADGQTISDVIEKYENDEADRLEKASSKTDMNIHETRDDDYLSQDRVDIDFLQTYGTDHENIKPNYFVCVRVTDPDVQRVVVDVQASILDRHPNYIDYTVPQPNLHVTLCTLQLGNTDHITDACRVLKSAKMDLCEILKEQDILCFKGVGDFHQRVLYAKLQYSKSVTRIINYLQKKFKQEGLAVVCDDQFVPHMTIMKLSRAVNRNPEHSRAVPGNQEQSYFDSSLYTDVVNTYFGTQVVDEVHLCSMLEEHRQDGFYASMLSLQLEDN